LGAEPPLLIAEKISLPVNYHLVDKNTHGLAIISQSVSCSLSLALQSACVTQSQTATDMAQKYLTT